jgi:hypothetical protein
VCQTLQGGPLAQNYAIVKRNLKEKAMSVKKSESATPTKDLASAQSLSVSDIVVKRNINTATSSVQAKLGKNKQNQQNYQNN